MNKLAKVSIITSLVLSILACSVLSPQADKTSEITLTDEKPIVVLDTGNSEYPRIVLYKGDEVIVPDLDIDQNGEIIDVQGATFISPDGNSIYLYFENGMPVRAIVDEHLIQFENFIGGTVDITFISPDGTVTKKEHVPFDSSQIPSIGFQSNAHLASIVRMPNNKDINWLSFVQNATTAFFCVAAATAVIVPTAGTATAILAAGCAVLIYSAYLAIANKEPPISVEKADIAISGAGCALGVVKKDPIAVKDCADAVIDTVEVVKKETHEIEQKLVTKVGADPTRRDTLFSTSIAEPISPTVESQSEYGCDNPNLMPEELINCGTHMYRFESIKIEEQTGQHQCNLDPTFGTENFEFIFSFVNGRLTWSSGWENQGSNKWLDPQSGIHERTIVLLQDGFSYAFNIYWGGDTPPSFMCKAIQFYKLIGN